MEVLRRTGIVIAGLVPTLVLTACGQGLAENGVSTTAVRRALAITWPVHTQGATMTFSLSGTGNAVDISAINANKSGFTSYVTRVFGQNKVIWTLVEYNNGSGSLVLVNDQDFSRFQTNIFAQSKQRVSQGLSPLGYSPTVMAEMWTPVGPSHEPSTVTTYDHGVQALVTYKLEGRRYIVELLHMCRKTHCAWFPSKVSWSETH